MPSSTAELTALFEGPTRWHTLDHRDEVSSTNDVAADSLAAGVPPGLVVVADRQTAGRGRQGRTWEDRADGASLLVSVTIAAPRARTLVPLVAGLAVVEALDELGIAAVLKWPNDVLVGDGKLAGLLAEGHEQGLVVGIGTNVDLRRAPVAGATSVAEHVDRDDGALADRWRVLVAQLRSLDRWLTRLERDGAGAVVSAYRDRCATLGREVAVELVDGTRLVGTAHDITPEGALVLAAPDGRHEVTAGDVHHVRRA